MTYCHIWGIIFRISIRSTSQVSKYEKTIVSHPAVCALPPGLCLQILYMYLCIIKRKFFVMLGQTTYICCESQFLCPASSPLLLQKFFWSQDYIRFLWFPLYWMWHQMWAESAWDIPYLNRKIFIFRYQISKS